MFPVSCLPCKETLQIMCFFLFAGVYVFILRWILCDCEYRLTATTKQIKSRNKLKQQQQQQQYDK